MVRNSMLKRFVRSAAGILCIAGFVVCIACVRNTGLEPVALPADSALNEALCRYRRNIYFTQR